jgi:hypothetical protein
MAGGSPTQPGGFNGDARPVLGNGDLRQLRNQANQIAGDVQELRRQMQSAGSEANDLRSLDEVLNGLRALGATADPQSLEQLSAQALEKLQRVEYDLRKKVDTANQELFVQGSDEIAPQFRTPVNNYFRELSRKTGSGTAASKK